MPNHILRVDSSARVQGSVTRDLTSTLIDRLDAGVVTTRDLSEGVPLLTEAWVTANFTPADQRTEAQAAELAMSDNLVAELLAADTIVIGTPIYNFSVPAALKAWIDQVARAGVTFKYTDKGPVGLLEGKRAIIVIASGGTKSGSDVDYATDYMRHVLGFLGITDVAVVTADQLMMDADAAMQTAAQQIQSLAA